MQFQNIVLARLLALELCIVVREIYKNYIKKKLLPSSSLRQRISIKPTVSR